MKENNNFAILNSKSDNELAEEFRKGNNLAFDILVERFKGVIIKIVSVYNSNAFDRDDLEQECRIACFNAINSFNPEKNTSLKNYTAFCINNRLLNYIQKKTSKMISSSDDFIPLYDEDLKPNSECVEPGAEEKFIASENLNNIKDLFKDILSSAEYEVLTLYLDDNSYEEIANSTGMTVKSVDNALQRVRKKLKFMLE